MKNPFKKSTPAAETRTPAEQVAQRLEQCRRDIGIVEQELRASALEGALAGPDSPEQARAYSLGNKLTELRRQQEMLVVAGAEADRRAQLDHEERDAREWKAKVRAFKQHAAQWRGHLTDVATHLDKAATAFDRALKNSRALTALTPYEHIGHELIHELISDRPLQAAVLTEMRRLSLEVESGILDPTIRTRLLGVEHDHNGRCPDLAALATEWSDILVNTFSSSAPSVPPHRPSAELAPEGGESAFGIEGGPATGDALVNAPEGLSRPLDPASKTPPVAADLLHRASEDPGVINLRRGMPIEAEPQEDPSDPPAELSPGRKLEQEVIARGLIPASTLDTLIPS